MPFGQHDLPRLYAMAQQQAPRSEPCLACMALPCISLATRITLAEPPRLAGARHCACPLGFWLCVPPQAQRSQAFCCPSFARYALPAQRRGCHSAAARVQHLFPQLLRHVWVRYMERLCQFGWGQHGRCSASRHHAGCARRRQPRGKPQRTCFLLARPYLAHESRSPVIRLNTGLPG